MQPLPAPPTPTSSSPPLPSTPFPPAGTAEPLFPARLSPATAARKSPGPPLAVPPATSAHDSQQHRASLRSQLRQSTRAIASETVETSPKPSTSRRPNPSPPPSSHTRPSPPRLPPNTSPPTPPPPTASIPQPPANSARAHPSLKPRNSSPEVEAYRNARSHRSQLATHSPTHTITPSPDEPAAPLHAELHPEPIAAIPEKFDWQTADSCRDRRVSSRSPRVHHNPRHRRHLLRRRPLQPSSPAPAQLEEEILDEEDYNTTLHASSIEEMDDFDEEETLEGAADLGTMIREMSIDQITRSGAERRRRGRRRRLRRRGQHPRPDRRRSRRRRRRRRRGRGSRRVRHRRGRHPRRVRRRRRSPSNGFDQAQARHRHPRTRSRPQQRSWPWTPRWPS